MKKNLFLIAGLLLICGSQLQAQKYFAYDFWKMENDSTYIGLTKRQNAGESLSAEELKFFDEYKTKLDLYFSNMPDDEKALYYKNRSVWATGSTKTNEQFYQQEQEVFAGDRSTYSKYLLTSGLFGLTYGSAGVAVLELNGGAAVGLPLLSAGASTLIPVLTLKDRSISYNSLSLSIHGKAMGWAHGVALSSFIAGENADEKLTLIVSSLSSIGLGRMGYILGRDQPWTKGRVALYGHYGVLMPFEGLALDAAFKIEDPRILGATFLIFGAGGYLMADRIADMNDYTVGDITATQALTALNAYLGIGIMADIIDHADAGPGVLIIPALAALGGSFAGNLWLKDTRLTNQQGWNTVFAATGGTVIGLGLVSLFGSESFTPYYIVPYITGITSYSLLVSRYKKLASLALSTPDKDNNWCINFMPQNILLNNKIEGLVMDNPGKKTLFLPAFSASLTF